jgi:hypothetical protein
MAGLSILTYISYKMEEELQLLLDKIDEEVVH